MSKQTHIFATRSDLNCGLKQFESSMEVKYVRCDLYYGPVYEQYLSLMDWPDLGKNATGDHISGPRFLIIPRDNKINIELVPQVAAENEPNKRDDSVAWICDSAGHLSKQTAPLDDYLAKLETQSGARDREDYGQTRYDVSQNLNPDSITFLPGGIYKGEKIMVCGHIGTISESAVSRNLYKAFVNYVTKGFEKIGSYRVGPEAIRLMDEGYRMVTIGITSTPAYDLHRSVAR